MKRTERSGLQTFQNSVFSITNDRVTHSAELDAIIGEWTRQHEKREAMEKLIAVGVPAVVKVRRDAEIAVRV